MRHERPNWKRIKILIALSIALFLLTLYISIIRVNWNFTTLRAFDGHPIALDFSNFWAAAKLALSGKSILVYNIDILHAVERQYLGSQHFYLSGFYYPPVCLLLLLPLGLLSYLPSLLIWLGITFLLYMLVLTRISHNKLLIPFFLLFPGMFQNILFGQNAFLSGFLLGSGLILLNNSPVIAGCLFGLLCYKPQFIILILVVLLVGHYWKALIATIATAIIFLIISIMVFGYKIWVAYFKIMAMPMKLLEIGQTDWSIMPGFLAATLSSGFTVRTAFVVQTVVMLIVVMAVVWVWGKNDNFALKSAILILGLLLFTPYAPIYEMALLALPLCWLWEDGRLRGRLPGESFLLLCGWLMPFFLQSLWWRIDFLSGKFQIGPFILMLLFLLTLTKVKGWITIRKSPAPILTDLR
jgi:hypothetical protein